MGGVGMRGKKKMYLGLLLIEREVEYWIGSFFFFFFFFFFENFPAVRVKTGLAAIDVCGIDNII